MTNDEKYKSMAEEGIKLASSIAAFPSDDSPEFSLDNIMKSLYASKDFEVRGYNDDVEDGIAEKALRVLVEYKGTEYDVSLYLMKNQIELEYYHFANHVEENELKTAGRQEYLWESVMFYDGRAIESYHLQIKLLMAILPTASLLVDFRSFRILSPKWASMTAQSPTPPSTDYLYTVHSIYDESGESPMYWFHTHGLTRCGSPEIEMMNFTREPKVMFDMINMIAKKFVDDPAPEGESFAVAYDGSGVDMAWIRWEHALAKFPEDILGGVGDRADNDGEPNIHADPSGILFAVDKDGEFVSPEIHAKALSEDPLYFISTEETNRMSALARERYPYFRTVFNTKRYNGVPAMNAEGQYEWNFIVKLGLQTDNADDENDREHLWFEVLSLANDAIEAKLINQPYMIERLNEGDVGVYTTDVLTDWLIYGPNSAYNTDTIYQLVM